MNRRNISWKWIPTILIVFFLISYAVLEASGLIRTNSLEDWVSSFSLPSWIFILLLLLVDIVVPIPSSVVAALAGKLYGPACGTLIGYSGLIGASLAGFFIMKKAKKRIQKKFLGEEEFQKMDDWFEKWGELAIVLSRLFPMANETLAFTAGLSQMSWRRFFVLATLGTLPISVVYAYIGEKSKNPAEFSFYITLAFLFPAIVWIFFKKFSKNKKSQEDYP